MRRGLGMVAVLLFAVLVPVSPARARDDLSRLTEHIRRHLEGQDPARLLVDGDRLLSAEALPGFYERRGFAPAWSDGHDLAAAADSVLAVVAELQTDGLRPEDYGLAHLRRLRADLADGPAGRPRLACLLDLDLLLTDAWLLAGSHLLSGRINPETIDPEWFVRRRDGDLAAALERALAEGRPAAALRAFRPPQPGYARLRAALADYRELRRIGGWSPVPPGPTLHPGDQGPRVAALQARLAVTGDDQGPATAILDAGLEAAVKHFQARHGLEVDGTVGPATLAALAVPVSERIEQLKANLERWRWLPQDLGTTYVLVNIAAQQLSVWHSGRQELEMAVIVGRSFRRTPVFSGRMTYLVLSPAWEVPPSLAVQDKLPELQADPGRLADLGFQAFAGWEADAPEIDLRSVDWTRVTPETFGYRLRQKPGPQNALGRVKFMFPNRYSVYLHDTPSRELFRRASRAFSSGCIRIEDPEALAVKLLADQPAWTPEAIREAMQAGVERTVALKQPVSVHLLYWTAWVADDGQVCFRDDVYHRDAPLQAALASAAPEEP
ncbi:MAG: L,D-transpeptidase family protein [Candidatus Krumholzibacteriia bacterium]